MPIIFGGLWKRYCPRRFFLSFFPSFLFIFLFLAEIKDNDDVNKSFQCLLCTRYISNSDRVPHGCSTATKEYNYCFVYGNLIGRFFISVRVNVDQELCWEFCCCCSGCTHFLVFNFFFFLGVLLCVCSHLWNSIKGVLAIEYTPTLYNHC